MISMKDLKLAIKAAKLGATVIKRHYSKPDITVKGVRDVITNADFG